eukprot:NODE_546_length_6859_cov_0.302071.p3 type:complete len:186 gc:universal NODE_546_length_6859_cov_0.302071:5723-5166(-)
MRAIKNQVRKELKNKYSQVDFIQFEAQLTSNCLKFLSNMSFDKIGVFSSLKHEQPTNMLIQELLRMKKEVYLPKMFKNEIKFLKIYTTQGLVSNKYDILEPHSDCSIAESLDVVVVPGLLFDAEGFRLGYGKGCYDKYLAKSSALKIGYCASIQFTDDKNKVPKEQHDISLDVIISDSMILLINK